MPQTFRNVYIFWVCRRSHKNPKRWRHFSTHSAHFQQLTTIPCQIVSSRLGQTVTGMCTGGTTLILGMETQSETESLYIPLQCLSSTKRAEINPSYITVWVFENTQEAYAEKLELCYLGDIKRVSVRLTDDVLSYLFRHLRVYVDTLQRSVHQKLAREREKFIEITWHWIMTLSWTWSISLPRGWLSRYRSCHVGSVVESSQHRLNIS